MRIVWKRHHAERQPDFDDYYSSWKSQQITNHKVASVEEDDVEDVYDITVDGYHNFALSAGVFVHNCGYEDSRTLIPRKGYEGGGRVFFKNSWSASWGQGGYGSLSYAYLREHADDLWCIARVEDLSVQRALVVKLAARARMAEEECVPTPAPAAPPKRTTSSRAPR